MQLQPARSGEKTRSERVFSPSRLHFGRLCVALLLCRPPALQLNLPETLCCLPPHFCRGGVGTLQLKCELSLLTLSPSSRWWRVSAGNEAAGDLTDALLCGISSSGNPAERLDQGELCTVARLMAKRPKGLCKIMEDTSKKNKKKTKNSGVSCTWRGVSRSTDGCGEPEVTARYLLHSRDCTLPQGRSSSHWLP